MRRRTIIRSHPQLFYRNCWSWWSFRSVARGRTSRSHASGQLWASPSEAFCVPRGLKGQFQHHPEKRMTVSSIMKDLGLIINFNYCNESPSLGEVRVCLQPLGSLLSMSLLPSCCFCCCDYYYVLRRFILQDLKRVYCLGQLSSSWLKECWGSQGQASSAGPSQQGVCWSF